MKHSNASFFVILLAVSVLSACGTAPAKYDRSVLENFSRSSGDYGGPALTESLFNYKDRTLSEEDIRRILDGQIGVRDSVRLAVFNYGGSMARYGAWRWYDEESLQNQQHLLDTLNQALARSQRVQKVIFLPSLVTGNNPNINQLRESAVRMQADMLVIFSLNSDIFQKYRAFKKDEAKAFATCEVVLMDIRTGVIPHTYVVTKSAQTTKIEGDFTEEEMQKRVLRTASLQALLEAGNKTAAFLNTQK